MIRSVQRVAVTVAAASLLAVGHVRGSSVRGRTGEPVINEFSASTAGTDVEYVELLAEPGTDLSGYRVLEIEGDAGSALRPGRRGHLVRRPRRRRPGARVAPRERARERHDLAPARHRVHRVRSATTSTRTTTASSTTSDGVDPRRRDRRPRRRRRATCAYGGTVARRRVRRPHVRARRRLAHPRRRRHRLAPRTGCATTSTRPASPATPVRSIGGEARTRPGAQLAHGRPRPLPPGELRSAGRDDRLRAGPGRDLAGRRRDWSRSKAS